MERALHPAVTKGGGLLSQTRFVGTGANDNAVGNILWDVPTAITASDNTRTPLLSGSDTSQYLKGTNCGFSIPSTATIRGIILRIERFNASGAGSVNDNRVRLVKAGVVQSTDKSAGAWSNSALADEIVAYGGETDLWGGAWTAADINGSGFGAVLSIVYTAGSDARVDAFSLTVYYSDPLDHYPEVGPVEASPLHTNNQPVPYGVLGHYRVSYRVPPGSGQGQPKFELQNPSASVLVVPLGLVLTTVSSTPATVQEEYFSLSRLTGFTTVDNVAATTLTPSKVRTTMPAPVAVAVGVTTGGGMVGGTYTIDSSSAGIHPNWSMPSGATQANDQSWSFEDDAGGSPFVLAQNEGLLLQRIPAATGTGWVVYISLSWAEVSAY